MVNNTNLNTPLPEPQQTWTPPTDTNGMSTSMKVILIVLGVLFAVGAYFGLR